ncbi:proline--tRNA ligase [Patescibacteria group bacterium]|nr:proline--tRNA ligase [Patescibacteria group bacterium]
MRYSKLLGKTLKKAPREAEAISHKLLIRAGFIDRQVSAGIYSFLPLGWRVHQKIANIIREEMDAIGGQEVFLPTLQPKELWDRSDRWDHMDPPLFKLKDRHKKEFALGSTHEEVITDLAARFIKSYKNLPLYLYQIQNKFRNEMRSTGGLLRVREFVMKDLYSFHTTEKDLNDYYQKVIEAYKKIFKRCGFVTKITEASSGTIGGDISHEFMMICPTGEDSVYFCTKCDFATSKEKKTECEHCGYQLKEGRAIENGHVFKLGTKYSKSMDAYFIDKNGKKKLIWMGCYGIGIGRLMATVVEAHHDKKGIIWPKSVAPFQAHLLAIGEKAKVKKFAEGVFKKLMDGGIEVLFDDREDISAGEKFAEADLIGIPVRLVVSEETFKEKKIEWKERDKEKTTKLAIGQAIKKLANA